MLLFCSVLWLMINLSEVSANFIYKTGAIHLTSREVTLVNLICENNHGYKRLLVVCWDGKKKETNWDRVSWEHKCNYSEAFIYHSHDVIILSLWVSVPLKYSQKRTTGLSWSVLQIFLAAVIFKKLHFLLSYFSQIFHFLQIKSFACPSFTFPPFLIHWLFSASQAIYYPNLLKFQGLFEFFKCVFSFEKERERAWWGGG